jgi:choline dehydrogenase-like flavoprotein
VGTYDLNSQSGATHVDADVCVIGAGPVGLSVARRLAGLGSSVVVLERGGMTAQPQNASTDIAFDTRPYGGATAGRAWGLGGTSALWGGQLLPVMQHEVESSIGASGTRWPIQLSEIEPHYRTIDSWLKIDGSAFEITPDVKHPLAALDWTGFSPRYSKWLSFGRRHIWTAWQKELQREPNLNIWLNARVIKLEGGGPRIRRVAARGLHAELTVSAERFVLAAGAIESTKLALAVFDEPAMTASKPAALGHYLHDHLSLRVAQLVTTHPRRFRELFAPSFLAGTMRTLRIELARDLGSSASLPASYAHIVADVAVSSGFAVIRDVLRAAQRRRPREALTALGRVPRALPEIVELAFWRIARKRLVAPKPAALYFHIDFQQTPDVRNRIYLSQERDADGSRRARIDWNVFDDKAHYVSAFKEHLIRLWRQNRLERTATLEFLTHPDGVGHESNVYDIYHPAGTTRMGVDSASACVDRHLLLFGTHNVFIAGTSVFPALGVANPTYTAMALGVRLADHINSKGNDATVGRIA